MTRFVATDNEKFQHRRPFLPAPLFVHSYHFHCCDLCNHKASMCSGTLLFSSRLDTLQGFQETHSKRFHGVMLSHMKRKETTGGICKLTVSIIAAGMEWQ